MGLDWITIHAGRLVILVDVTCQQAVLYRPPSAPIACSLDELLAACRRVRKARKP